MDRNVACLCELGDFPQQRLVARVQLVHMKFANAQSARFTIIIGEDELKSKTASIKNMESGEQIAVQFDSVVEHLRKNKQN